MTSTTIITQKRPLCELDKPFLQDIDLGYINPTSLEYYDWGNDPKIKRKVQSVMGGKSKAMSLLPLITPTNEVKPTKVAAKPKNNKPRDKPASLDLGRNYLIDEDYPDKSCGDIALDRANAAASIRALRDAHAAKSNIAEDDITDDTPII